MKHPSRAYPLRREGCFLNQQTQVKNMKVRSRAARLEEAAGSRVQVEELPRPRGWGYRLIRLEQLGKNLVVVGCLFMVVVAVKNTETPQAQSVFQTLQTSAGMEWDETVGKLSFVHSLLPQQIQEVWKQEESIAVFTPVKGDVIHAWSREQPYVMIQTKVSDVRAAADGEVMSIAHGLDEERIVRVRHDDSSEAIYGNLSSCHVEVGDRIYAGDVFARILDGEPLAFELRVDGRSIDPSGKWKPFEE